MSQDFSKTYVGYYQVKWTDTFNFTWDDTQQKWIDGGTKGSIDAKTPIPLGGNAGKTDGKRWNDPTTYVLNYN